jgi:hypothetical protein
MSSDQPLHPAEALAAALENAAELRDRCAAAEVEVYELKIALEDAHGSVNRLSMQLAEERQRRVPPEAEGITYIFGEPVFGSLKVLDRLQRLMRKASEGGAS